MDSDSEESFHSVQEGEADLWKEMNEVDEELQFQKRDSEFLDEKEFNPSEMLLPKYQESSVVTLPDPVASSRVISKSVIEQELSKSEASCKLSVPMSQTIDTLPNRKASIELHPSSLNQEELEDAVINSPVETSDADTPSEHSTQSDKDSGNEAHGWDKFNAGDLEVVRKAVCAPAEKVLDSVADDWERGWDEDDVTEEEINAVSRLHTPNSKSNVTETEKPSVCEEKKTLPTEAAKPIQEQSQGYWGKLGGWGTSLFSSAASASKDSGITSLTSQVGQAFSSVFETVEKTLGAPKPEELAVMNKSENEVPEIKLESERRQISSTDLGDEKVSGWLAGITSKVQTGSKLIVATGLDVLEGIGQKTMEVVNDKDPGLRQTKALLTGKPNLPNLSDVLLQAKSTRLDTKPAKGDRNRDDKISFVHFFTEEQGSTSWEALEILSKQCANRLEKLLETHSSSDILIKFAEIDDLCQPKELDVESQSETHVGEDICKEYRQLGIGLREPHKLLHLYVTAQEFLNENNKAPSCDSDLWARNVHRNGVRFLAACAAKSLEQIRKISEMLYLNSSDGTHNDEKLLKNVEVTRNIVGLFCIEMDRLANQYATCLAMVGTGEPPSSSSNKTSVSAQITDIFVESSNSSRYLQDAVGILAPIFKLALLEGKSAKLLTGSTRGKRTD